MATECVVPMPLHSMKYSAMGLDMNGHSDDNTCLEDNLCDNDLNDSEVLPLNSDDERDSPDPEGDLLRRGARWRYKKRGEMTPEELALARERDRIQSRKRREKAELRRLENLKEHEIKVDDARHTSPIAMLEEVAAAARKGLDIEKNYDIPTNTFPTSRRRRVVKKRNRSDMSPEELARLRERERKAQQNRRDRIRAQKALQASFRSRISNSSERQSHGWHEDDAAWEAFLSQSEDNAGIKGNSKNAHIPSMVCAPPDNQYLLKKAIPEPLLGGGGDSYRNGIGAVEGLARHRHPEEYHPEERSIPSETPDSDKHSYKREASPLPDESDLSRMETASTGSGSINGQSVFYSSDENSKDGSVKDENGKKVGRRHYLPSEELERIRKRERDAKRKQREKARMLNSDKSMVSDSIVSYPSSGSHASSGYHSLSPAASHPDVDPTVSSMSAISPSAPPVDTSRHVPADNSSSERLKQYLKHSEQREIASPDASLKEPVNVHHKHMQSLEYAVPRHSHIVPAHSFASHTELVPVSPHTPGAMHMIPPHIPHHSPHHHYPPIVYLAPDVPHMASYGHGVSAFSPIELQSPKKGMASSRCSSQQVPSSVSSAEKKRMISRNVDRKKLSEEELEELRRRERDYQRERRARIRMEKARTQARQDKPGGKDDDDKASMYYHHEAFLPHHHHQMSDYPVHHTPGSINHLLSPLDHDAEYSSSRHHSPSLQTARDDYRQEESVQSRHSKEMHGDLGVGSESSEMCDKHEHGKEQHVDSEEELSNSPAAPSQKEADSKREVTLRLAEESLDVNDTSSVPQVVPTNRSFEYRRSPVVEKASAVENFGITSKETKKNILESICSSLKGEDDVKKEVSTDEKQDTNVLAVTKAEDDFDDDRLIIVQPNTEEAMPVPAEKKKKTENNADSEENLHALKEELMRDVKGSPRSTISSQGEEQNTEEKWRYWKEGLTEDQLERRRRSNREAQRRRRARLRMQGNTCDEPPYYESIVDSHGHLEPGYYPAGMSITSTSALKRHALSDSYVDRRNKIFFEADKYKSHVEYGVSYRRDKHSPGVLDDEHHGKIKGCRVKMTPAHGSADREATDERYSPRKDHHHRYVHGEKHTTEYLLDDKHGHFAYGESALTHPHHKRHHVFYYPDHTQQPYHVGHGPVHSAHGSVHSAHGSVRSVHGHYYQESYPHHHYFHEKLPHRSHHYVHSRDYHGHERHPHEHRSHHPVYDAAKEERVGECGSQPRIHSPPSHSVEKLQGLVRSVDPDRPDDALVNQSRATELSPVAQTESDVSPVKQSGRKRKQFIPRKVMPNASATGDFAGTKTARETNMPESHLETDLSGHELMSDACAVETENFCLPRSPKRLMVLDPNENKMDSSYYGLEDGRIAADNE